ncbi:MAG: signal peptidase I [Chloroflexi bacterium]|nr:signal peptidase I [Chloroflexota bacterium]
MTDLETFTPHPIPDIEPTPVPPAAESESLGELVWEILQTLILAGLLIVFFRSFVFQNYIVEGNSMLDTLLPNERLIVSRLSYIIGEPQRGDIIVFQYPRDPNRDFVKRIIGMPGETISIQNNHIFIDGQPLPPEPYVHYPEMASLPPTTLGDNEYFVMGDNRPGSSDSRSWGPLAKRFIIGKAWLVYFPLNRIHLIPHPNIEPGT